MNNESAQPGHKIAMGEDLPGEFCVAGNIMSYSTPEPPLPSPKVIAWLNVEVCSIIGMGLDAQR